MTEAQLRTSIIKYIKDNGGDAWAVHGSSLQRRGEPDIDGAITIDGVHIHLKIEVKLDYNKPTPLQAHRLAQYRDFGYCAFTAYSVSDVIENIQTFVDRIKRK